MFLLKNVSLMEILILEIRYLNKMFHLTVQISLGLPTLKIPIFKNADFEYIKTNGYAFLFNQYKLDNSQNDDWFRYLWSFKGAEFNSNVAFFRRIFPARVNFSYVKFNNIFYFTDCKFPLKIEAKCFDFSPKNIPDFETSIRTLRVALEECYCNYAKDDLLIWEKKAYETSNKTIIDDEKENYYRPELQLQF